MDEFQRIRFFAGPLVVALLALLVPVWRSSRSVSQQSTGHPPLSRSEVLFRGAVFWLGDPSDPARTAQCILTSNGGESVGSLGHSQRECEDLAATGPGATIVDLGGAFALPGFVEPHAHVINAGELRALTEGPPMHRPPSAHWSCPSLAGLALTRVDLRGCKSPAELSERISEAAQSIPTGGWLLGGNWDQEEFGGALPEASWIDPGTSHCYVYLTRMCGHAALVNSRTLRLAGISAESHLDLGAEVVRGHAAEPTGVLCEGAMSLISQLVPPPPVEERLRALAAASRHALERGVTREIDRASASSRPQKEQWCDPFPDPIPSRSGA